MRKHRQHSGPLRRWEKLLGFLLFFTLAFFPFISINALFAELAIFVRELPEHDTIGSLIGAAFQIANVSPMILVAVGHYFRIRESLVIPVFIGLGVLDTLLLAVFWSANAGGHSVALLLLSFLSGIVGCTGVVFLFAYVSSNYHPLMIAATSTGLCCARGLL